MTDPLHILLVSPDLLSTSRIAGLAGEIPAQVETLRSLDGEPHGGPFDIVLVDLQAVAGDPAVIVARVRGIIDRQRMAAGRGARLIAFGPHVAKDRLAEAMAAGADAAVSRGELLGGFAALVRRCLG